MACVSKGLPTLHGILTYLFVSTNNHSSLFADCSLSLSLYIYMYYIILYTDTDSSAVLWWRRGRRAGNLLHRLLEAWHDEGSQG